MDLRRPVPLWALLLAILVSGSIAAVLVYLPRPLGPDFNLTLSSNPVFEQPNHRNSSIVKVESVRGFVGVVTFGIISPSGLSTALTQGSDYYSGGGNQLILESVGNLTLHTTATAAADYSVRIVATGGPASHYVDLVVRVQALAMTANTTSLTIARGSSGTIAVSLKDLNGLSGNASLSGDACLPYHPYMCSTDTYVTMRFAPSNVILQPGGSATIILTVTVSNSDTPMGDYLPVYAVINSWWFGLPLIHLTIV